jgi:hypothetical protein
VVLALGNGPRQVSAGTSARTAARPGADRHSTAYAKGRLRNPDRSEGKARMSRMNRKEAPPVGRDREAFEAFIRREPHYREFADLDNVLAKHRGEYLDPLIKGAWMAWNGPLSHV